MISVLVPAYNAAPFLGEALESILREAESGLEIIVIDDGSSDGTSDVAREFRVRCLQSAHRGVAAARNLGLEAATGELLAWLDADDRWVPGRMVQQLRALSAEPALDAVYGHVQQFAVSQGVERKLGPPRPGRLPGTMLIRREAMLRVGGFDESLRIGEFMDWLVRAREHGIRDAMLDCTCLERRIHTANLGITGKAHLGDYLRVARRSLARAREG